MRGDFRHRHDGHYLLPAVLRERHDDEIGIGRLLHRAARRRQRRWRYDVGQAHRQTRRETGARDGLHRRGDRLGFHGVCGLHLAKPPHRVRNHDHHRPRPRLHHGHAAQLYDAGEHRREGIELGAGRAVPRPLHRHRDRARHHGRVRRARKCLPAGQSHGRDAERGERLRTAPRRRARQRACEPSRDRERRENARGRRHPVTRGLSHHRRGHGQRE